MFRKGRKIFHRERILRVLFILPFIALLGILFLPLPSFTSPSGTLMYSREGRLLGARIASDGQWRFPMQGRVPQKFSDCILNFEDAWFYYHPGINPVAVLRAATDNLKSGRIISGASTITMQLMRISGRATARTMPNKLKEMIQSIKTELIYSKEEILSSYCANAPFGGNVVGLEAASWRYFGCPANQLSWGESAGLAVLPNAPSLIYPGKNESLLKQKRDHLLQKLYRKHLIDSITYILAMQEPLPSAPSPLPDLAPHLLERLRSGGEASVLSSSLSYKLQEASLRLLKEHSLILRENHIYNMSAIIAEIESGEVLAYLGNPFRDDPQGGAVDMANARRSSGSILKPFLYAAMLDAGMIMPNSLLPDLPIHFSGYSPKNFDLRFRGAVPASRALSQSLNLPAVWMLRQYGAGRFLILLRELGFTSFSRDADHYGLSLILGGGEVKLDELVAAYASLGRILLRFETGQAYMAEDIHPLVFNTLPQGDTEKRSKTVLQAAGIFSTLEAMKNVGRPQEEAGWKNFSSAGLIAWKTGTSFGFRDAWAVGLDKKYVVGVWAGNADGEGRPNLTGLNAAAPLLFDLFGLLEKGDWYDTPLSEMKDVAVCRKSGYRASEYCDEKDTLAVPVNCLQMAACPYHRPIFLDEKMNGRVHMNCYPPTKIKTINWFILPPAMGFYYRNFDATYTNPPPYLPACESESDIAMLEIVYPGQDMMVYLPKEMTGAKGQVILEAAHRNPVEKIYWHLDDAFLGSTTHYHKLACTPLLGEHTLVLVDSRGNTVKRTFRVLE